MSGEVRVTTTHLRELSVRLAQACAELRSENGVVDGVDAAVHGTHGPVAWAATCAVEAAQRARRAARADIAGAAGSLSDKLTVAATRYDQADQLSEGNA